MFAKLGLNRYIYEQRYSTHQLMELQTITIAELPTYLTSEDYRHAEYVAISKQRAQSHMANPRARQEDVVLVLVYEEKELVAYLGVFADDLHFVTGVEHVGWLSCMWVNPKMRGRGIAKKLLQTVFEAWSYKILVTEFTPAAKGLYDRSGHFIDLAKPKGVRGYLRPNLATLLSQKDPKWNKWRPLLRWIDATLRGPNALRLWFRPRSTWESAGYSIAYLNELDEETARLQAELQTGELIKRGREELNWLMRHPWLLQAPMKDRNARRYHFSSVAKRFSFLGIKVYDADLTLVAFVLLSVRDRAAKLPYVYCRSGAEEVVWQILDDHLLAMNIDVCTLYHPQLVQALEQRKTPFFKVRTFQRHYIIGKVLESALQAMGEFKLQDGDADAAFT